MSTRLIAELGSCHMGKLERIKEAIDRCKASGIDALKLQLFPNEARYTDAGNVWLDPSLFTEAFLYGRSIGFSVSASAFDEESARFLMAHNPEFIKLAYSKKDQSHWFKPVGDHRPEMIISCDVMTDHLVPTAATKLYCIPEYPVRYEVCFDELFPRFNGFSDHTLGIRQTINAVKAGAILIEKHVRLGYADETCPDARFAVLIEDLGRVRDYSSNS